MNYEFDFSWHSNKNIQRIYKNLTCSEYLPLQAYTHCKMILQYVQKLTANWTQ